MNAEARLTLVGLLALITFMGKSSTRSDHELKKTI